ncbi:MAG: DnaJ domain-containing protein [Bacillota bacterium]|nr:DnaJ domain-containing protein [Bacillota bacterium]
MYKKLDLYMTLQVHEKAELEIISGAYKRLSKKYHPDINKDKNAEEKMKQINYAFSILSDADERKKYDDYLKNIVQKNSYSHLYNYPKEFHKEIKKASKLLNSYFECLSSGDIKAGFDKISLIDKKKITLSDFLNWQKQVLKYFKIIDWDISFKNIDNSRINIGDVINVFVFNVVIEEREALLGKCNVVNIERLVLSEGDNLGVYLGYEDLKEETRKLLKAVNSTMETIEDSEFAIGEKLIRKYVNEEVKRALKYNRSFSLIMVEVFLNKGDNMNKEDFEAIITKVMATTRSSDKVTALTSERLMVFLPETGLRGAKKAAEKIKIALMEHSINTGKSQLFKVEIAAHKD